MRGWICLKLFNGCLKYRQDRTSRRDDLKKWQNATEAVEAGPSGPVGAKCPQAAGPESVLALFFFSCLISC
jgi:hypothetical protein